MNSTMPFGLARRLAMSASEALARRDAALIARIDRQVGREGSYESDAEESEARWWRNRRARSKARWFVRVEAARRVALGRA